MSLDDFINKLLYFFPDLRTDVEREIEFDHGKILYTVIIEEVFMPEVVKLLEKESDKEKIVELFNYFEEVSTCDNKVLIENYFSVTVLEILGNDNNILKIAKKYMGPITTKLQRQADLDIGRKVD